MNIKILSRNANLYSTQRLIEACKKRKHDVEVIDPLKCFCTSVCVTFSQLIAQLDPGQTQAEIRILLKFTPTLVALSDQ